MIRRIKNFLFNLCKKKTILFVFFFSFFGLTFAKSASAGWVTELALNVAIWPIFQIARILIDLAIFLAEFAGSYLNWVLSPNFISYSYTNPANNPIIEVGLGVTQGFVNMLLVLILVYIAIATILRLAGYETKKLLITFIIVALLVNFAPVICGLIVDASNIVMNFFVQDLEGDAFGNAMSRKVSDIMSGYKETGTYAEAKPYMMQLIVLIPFLLGLTFILFIFAAIFVFRYIVIWLLVILSPLAFACYILPITRKYFDIWWKQFINWSFIGVTCGFFLYLGLLLVTKIQIGAAVGTPTITGQPAPFNSILPFFVSLAFLGIGLVFGLQTSAIGASTIISLSKRGQKWTTRQGYRAGRGVTKKIAGNIRSKVERPVRKAAARTARGIRWFGALDPIGRIPGLKNVPGLKSLRPFAPFKWALPVKTLSDIGNLRPRIEAAEKEADNVSGREKAHQIKTQSVHGPEAMGLLSSILKGNDAQDLFDAFRELGTDEEILKNKKFIDIMVPILKNAVDSGKLGSTLRRDTRLAKIAAGRIGSYKKLSPQQAVIRAVGEAREHIKDWEPETLEDPDVLKACLAQFDRDRWLQINRQVKNGQNTALKAMDKTFAEFKQKNKAKLSGKSDKDIWDGEFREFIKTNYGGDKYFIAVDEPRMKNTGWRIAEKPAPETPGEAIMGTEKEVEKLRSIGEKARQTQPLKSISEKRKEEQKLKSIMEKRKAKKEK